MLRRKFLDGLKMGYNFIFLWSWYCRLC